MNFDSDTHARNPAPPTHPPTVNRTHNHQVRSPTHPPIHLHTHTHTLPPTHLPHTHPPTQPPPQPPHTLQKCGIQRLFLPWLLTIFSFHMGPLRNFAIYELHSSASYNLDILKRKKSFVGSESTIARKLFQ